MADDVMYININMGDDDPAPNLLSALRNLQPIETEEKPVLITNVSSGKKSDKKKKKKKKSVLENIIEATDIELADDESNEDDDLLDADMALEFQERLIEDDDIIKGRKKNYSKDKKDANAFKKEFADEIRLLYGLLDETSKFGKEIEKDIDRLRGSKVRGTSKYTNDLIASAISAKTAKLSIVKEIVSIKKSIADLTIKAESKKKDAEGEGMNSDRLASRFFKNILNNRRNYIDAIVSDDYENDAIQMLDEHGELPMKDDDAEKYWSEKLDERISYTPNPDRSSAGDAYIKYENAGVEVFISRCIDTGEWELSAVDRDGNELDDYPLPTRRDLGKMKFSVDGQFATDDSGRIYKVRDYYLEDDDGSDE